MHYVHIPAISRFVISCFSIKSLIVYSGASITSRFTLLSLRLYESLHFSSHMFTAVKCSNSSWFKHSLMSMTSSFNIAPSWKIFTVGFFRFFCQNHAYNISLTLWNGSFLGLFRFIMESLSSLWVKASFIFAAAAFPKWYCSANCRRLFLLTSPKTLFVLKILSFCLDFLVMYRKGLIKKIKFIFKFYDVTAWLTNNSNTHTLPSRIDVLPGISVVVGKMSHS